VKFAVDARHVSHPQKGGYKTYATQLLRELGKVDTENEYIVILDRPMDLKDLFPFENYTFRVVPGTNPARAFLREQKHLNRICLAEGVDLLHSPSSTGPVKPAVPTILTIHDAIQFLPVRKEWERSGGRPQARQRLIAGYERWAIPRAAAKAHRVVTSTSQACDDLVKYVGIGADKVEVIPLSVDSRYRQMDRDAELMAALRRTHGLKGGFALCLGSVDPRKNIQLCFRAFAGTPPAGLELAVVSSHRSATDSLKALARSFGVESVRFIERVSDQELIAFYNMASVFLFPSIYEGFGLPPLEAMACGVPVIASNASCLPEVLGDAPRTVDPDDSVDLRKAIEEVVLDPETSELMRVKGFGQSRKYSGERQARATLEVYQAVVHESKANKPGLAPLGRRVGRAG
jgi:glycosyltransferase involved in cell wall biosynthesis